MSDDLLSLSGPEGRNQDAATFERQLEAMGASLGWELVFRNIDFQLGAGGQGPARGLDLLWSVPNPRDGKNYGWVQEAKRHDGMARYAQKAVHEEVHTLAGKVARARDLKAFREHREVKRRRLALVGGILTHRTPDFDPPRAAARLADLQLANKQGGASPVRVLFYGPDTLNSLAEAFDRYGEPTEFCWPVTRTQNTEWAPSCPPEQLAAGMLAWRVPSGDTVLWLRQDLCHDDLDALADIAWRWGISPERVLFSYLNQEQWRSVGKAWADLSAHRREHKTGRLPAEAEALDVSLDRLNRFDKVWKAAA